MTEQNMEDKLKNEYLSWVQSVQTRAEARRSAKVYLAEAEEKLKKAKRVFYLTTKDWVQARKEAERTKRRWKTYPYKMRQWAKKNMDQVFKLLENSK